MFADAFRRLCDLSFLSPLPTGKVDISDGLPLSAGACGCMANLWTDHHTQTLNQNDSERRAVVQRKRQRRIFSFKF